MTFSAKWEEKKKNRRLLPLHYGDYITEARTQMTDNLAKLPRPPWMRMARGYDWTEHHLRPWFLYFVVHPRCIFTPTVTSILPFNPNLGDQTLSSISNDFTTSILHVALLLLPSLGLKNKTWKYFIRTLSSLLTCYHWLSIAHRECGDEKKSIYLYSSKVWFLD